jgi:uncharacterized membrane protein
MARFVHGIEVDRIEGAIRAAELRSSAELRVSISRFYFWGDVRRAAAAVFRRNHMDRTIRRNGVLLFVAPRLHRFAVHVDVGVAQFVDDAFWSGIAAGLSHDFRAGDRTGGLERAIAAIADRLAECFPPTPVNPNELPDAVIR